MDSSKDDEYADLEWAVGINRFTLKMIGLWPGETLSRRQKLLADIRAFAIFCTLVFVSVIPGYFSLIRVWGDMMSMIDNLQITLPMTVTSLKIIIMWLRKKDLTPIISMVVADWIKKKTEQERDTMIKQALIARRLVMFGCVMMIFAILIITIPPFFGYSMRYLTNITDPGAPLLLQTYYLRDVTESPYFEIVFAAQTAAVFMAAFSYTGIDNFLGLIVFHICAQMEILKVRLLNLHDYKDFNVGLSVNVQDHIRIIRSVDVIENTFNLMLLALLAYFAVLFCLQGFLIISVSAKEPRRDDARFLVTRERLFHLLQIIEENQNVSFPRKCWLTSVIVNTFVHMCLYCVVGEILIAKCEGIYYAAYDYAWYTLKPNEARNLMLIMIRADKSLYITAGKIFPMTLSMFCSLIKTSAGYISVLLTNR